MKKLALVVTAVLAVLFATPHASAGSPPDIFSSAPSDWSFTMKKLFKNAYILELRGRLAVEYIEGIENDMVVEAVLAWTDEDSEGGDLLLNMSNRLEEVVVTGDDNKGLYAIAYFFHVGEFQENLAFRIKYDDGDGDVQYSENLLLCDAENSNELAICNKNPFAHVDWEVSATSAGVGRYVLTFSGKYFDPRVTVASLDELPDYVVLERIGEGEVALDEVRIALDTHDDLYTITAKTTMNGGALNKDTAFLLRIKEPTEGDFYALRSSKELVACDLIEGSEPFFCRDVGYFAGQLNLEHVFPSGNIPELIEPPADTDGDGVSDADDNCPEDFNANQIDVDEDGIGDVCDDDVVVDDGDDDEVGITLPLMPEPEEIDTHEGYDNPTVLSAHGGCSLNPHATTEVSWALVLLLCLGAAPLVVVRRRQR